MEENLDLIDVDKKRSGSNILKIIIGIVSIICTMLLILFVMYCVKNKIFTSQDNLISFLNRFGIWGPIIFVLIQIVQVIVPIFPGGSSCVIGVLIFGPVWGFVYNYIGIVIGSIIVFFISRKFGMALVNKLFKKELIDKYIGWLGKSSKFDKLFAFAIFLPVAPDDFLCYLAGLTNISVKRYILIILILKPFTLFTYSAGLAYILSLILSKI